MGPHETIQRLLSICPVVTYRGDELKCWTPDSEAGGQSKTYLNADDCDALAKAFAEVATALRSCPSTLGDMRCVFVAGHDGYHMGGSVTWEGIRLNPRS